MMTTAMRIDAPMTGTLEDLLAAWAPRDRAAGDAICVVCAGETLRVELRGGVPACACRECGSVLEDDAAVLHAA